MRSDADSSDEGGRVVSTTSAGEATSRAGSFGSADVRDPVDDVAGKLMADVVRFRLFAEISKPPRIGRFEVLGHLGQGGMGLVVHAWDPKLEREVAIKLLHRSGSAERDDRIQEEARSLARLNSPNVVQVYEVGEQDGNLFIVMEFIRGSSLDVWLEETRTLNERLSVLRQCAAGLEAAHRAGVVHQDFKPGNVLVGEDGRVRVADFGIAGRPAERLVLGGDSEASAPASIQGTPAYMAPEQLRAEAPSSTSDMFAFGVVAYEVLAGRHPFRAGTLAMLAAAIESVEPVPLSREVPDKARALVSRLLQKNAEDRPSTWAEVRAGLTVEPQESPSWRMRGAAVGALAVSIVGLAAWFDGAPASSGGGQKQIPEPAPAETSTLDERTPSVVPRPLDEGSINVGPLSFDPDGAVVARSDWAGGKVSLWELQGDRLGRQIAEMPVQEGQVAEAVGVWAAGRQVLVKLNSESDARVRTTLARWEVASDSVVQLSGGELDFDQTPYFAFHPASNRLAVVDGVRNDGKGPSSVRFYQLVGDEVRALGEFLVGDETIVFDRAIAWSASGDRVALSHSPLLHPERATLRVYGGFGSGDVHELARETFDTVVSGLTWVDADRLLTLGEPRKNDTPIHQFSFNADRRELSLSREVGVCEGECVLLTAAPRTLLAFSASEASVRVGHLGAGQVSSMEAIPGATELLAATEDGFVVEHWSDDERSVRAVSGGLARSTWISTQAAEFDVGAELSPLAVRRGLVFATGDDRYAVTAPGQPATPLKAARREKPTPEREVVGCNLDTCYVASGWGPDKRVSVARQLADGSREPLGIFLQPETDHPVGILAFEPGVSPDGTQMAFSSGNRPEIWIYDVRKQALSRVPLRVDTSDAITVQNIQWLPSGDGWLVSGMVRDAPQFAVWKVSNEGDMQTVWRDSNDWIAELAVSANGDHVAVKVKTARHVDCLAELPAALEAASDR